MGDAPLEQRASAPEAHAAPAAPERPAARVARASAVVAAGILASRVVGFLRQRATAHYFGTSELGDVLAAAFRVGNVAQNMLGEGTLSASFVPTYARLLGQGRVDEAKAFAARALGLLLVVVAAVTALGVALAPLLALFVGAGFSPEARAHTTLLVRIVVPMTSLLVLGAWALGVLTSHRRFFLPYAAPTLWSVAQIAALVLGHQALGLSGARLAVALALAALCGAVLQVVVLLPSTRRLLGSLRPRWAPGDALVRESARRLPGALLGRGVMQLSGLVDTLLVSFAGAGATAALGYAQTIYLLPMSVLGTGEAAAMLPELAREAGSASERGARDERLRATLSATLARVCTLAVPVVVVLSLFGREVVTLLLQTGSFDAGARARVVPLLSVYGLAVLANAAGRVLASTLYALGDTTRPARLALARVALSTALAIALLGRLGALGVVVGAMVAGWLEALLLALTVRREIGGAGLAGVPFAKLALTAALLSGVGLAARALAPDLTGEPLGALALLSLVGVTFVVAARALGLVSLGRLLRRR